MSEKVIFIGWLFMTTRQQYLQVYLEVCAYKTVDKKMIDYLSDNLLISTSFFFILKTESYKLCITIELI